MISLYPCRGNTSQALQMQLTLLTLITMGSDHVKCDKGKPSIICPWYPMTKVRTFSTDLLDMLCANLVLCLFWFFRMCRASQPKQVLVSFTIKNLFHLVLLYYTISKTYDCSYWVHSTFSVKCSCNLKMAILWLTYFKIIMWLFVSITSF